MIHYEPGTDGIESFIATTTAIALAVAAGTAGASVANAKIGSNANRDAAKLQTDALTESARIQSDAAREAARVADEATKRAELFQRRQAENTWQNTEATKRGNYDQWAAAQRRLGTVGSYIGMGDREIPDYVPGIDPRFTEDGTPAPGGAGAGPTGRAPAGSVDFTLPPDQLGPALMQFFKQNGVSDHETPYWVQKASELVARGQELNNPNYAMERLAAADVFGGGAASRATKQPYARPRTVEDYFTPTPQLTTPMTPALRMPGSVASYL